MLCNNLMEHYLKLSQVFYSLRDRISWYVEHETDPQKLEIYKAIYTEMLKIDE